MIKLLSLMIISVIGLIPIAGLLALRIEDWLFKRYDVHQKV